MSLASLKPIAAPTREQISATLAQLKWEDGSALFNSTEELLKGVNKIASVPLVEYKDIDFSVLKRNPEVITDTNMITEYKYGGLSSRK